jgi:membrane-associated phospholipid phosphatase
MDQSTHRMGLSPLHLPWARVVSDVLSPPVVWALLAFPIAHHAATGWYAVLWALLYGTLVCWMPVLYIAWNVRNGNITDLHMKVRRERMRPFLVTLLGTVLACAALWIAGAPRLMPLFAFFTMLQVGVMALITTRWQISIHAMSITGAVVALGALYGLAAGVVLSPLVVLVGTARYRLGRHTASQLVAGGLLGASVTVLLFLAA